MARHGKLSLQVTTVRPVKTLAVRNASGSVPFQKSKRYKELTELAENMHAFAKVQSSGMVRASVLSMFANHLLIIAHKQYRTPRR